MDIKYLILKSIYSTLSDSERHELNTWLEEGRNASLYERIKNNLKARDAVHFWRMWMWNGRSVGYIVIGESL